WQPPGLVALAAAVAFLIAAFGFSRSRPGDTEAAVVSGAAGALFAGAGGLLVLGGDQSWSQFQAWQYLLGAGCLLVASIIAIALVGQQIQYFVATAWAGLVALATCPIALAGHVDGTDAGAIAVTIVTALTAAFPILAIRLGKLPVPSLPTTTDELLADQPQIPLERVHGTVRRSDEILTGLLMGSSAVTLVGSVLLVRSGRPSALLFVAVVSVTVLLRARLFPTARHRIPLLIAGVGPLLLLASGIAASLTPNQRAMILLPLLVLLALLVMAVGRYFSDHQPTPYVARIADVLDVLGTLAIVPLMCLVVGLFGYVRGLWG
uniref:type VII secretion integral membrane protein EccD n=1 Tax=Cumulibacter manganitolerans TaxID=1884992 RepID=UPI001294C83A